MKCNACGIVGHKASVCQRKHSTHSGSNSSNWRAEGSNSNPSSRKVRDVEISENLQTSDSLSLYTITRVESIDSSSRFTVEPIINGIRVRMDLDTGAEVSVASSILYEQLGKPTLTPAPLLRAYGGPEIPTLGQCDVEVEFRSQRKRVPLVFAKSPTAKGLFGRPWIKQFNVLTLQPSVNNIDLNVQHSTLDAKVCAIQQEHIERGPADAKLAEVHRVEHIDSNTTIKTNNEAERLVHTFKRSIKASIIKGIEAEVDRCLQQFLLKYRVTPHGTTGRSPAELFLGRRPNTLLDRLRPDLKKHIIHRKDVQHRKRAEVGKPPDFNIGDKVYCRFWYGTRRWRKGIIVAIAGPLSYDVQVGDEVHRRNAAQLFHDRGIKDPDEQKQLHRLLDPPTIQQQSEKPQQQVVPPILQAPQPDARVPRLPNLEPVPKAPSPKEQPKAVPLKQETSAVPLKPQTSAEPPTIKKPPPPLRAPSTRVSKKPIRFDEEFSKLGSHN